MGVSISPSSSTEPPRLDDHGWGDATVGKRACQSSLESSIPEIHAREKVGKIQSENLLFDVHMPTTACVFHLQHIVIVTGAGGIVSLLSDRFRHKKNMSAWSLTMEGSLKALMRFLHSSRSQKKTRMGSNEYRGLV